MADSLRDILLDFQEAELATGVPRRMEVTPLPGKATVFIGPRRAGKSTFLFQIVRRLLDRGVPRENVLYLNLFDDRLRFLHRDGLGAVAEAYFSLYPEKKHAETVYCFFDEIQVVPGWEPFVDRLMRTERCEVYITGSSARMLSREIATQMRGRALAWEIFPFSFREFLDWKSIDAAGPLSTRCRLLVRKAFDEYWERGGFPEVAGLGRALRVKVHQEYWGAMLFRDLVERHDVAHPRAVVDLAHRLVDGTASLYSVNRLTGYLQSLGHRAPKAAVSSFVEWFEDAFFLFTVRPLRRVPGPVERESQEDLLRRPRPGEVGRFGRPRQRRSPAREPRVHGAAPVHRGHRLLPVRERARCRLHRTGAGRPARPSAGLRVAGGPRDAEAGSAGARCRDGGNGPAHRHHRDPRRGGDGVRRRRRDRGRAGLAVPA